MNMLFLDKHEIDAPLPRTDERVKHILRVLGKGAGDELLAGTPDGMIGTANIKAFDGNAMTFAFRPEREAPPLKPITLILGFPRPIQANRILKDLSSLGVAHIMLSGTELGEKSYFQSDFFKNREFRAALVEGAAQAANPRLPVVDTAWTLARALDQMDELHELDELDVIDDEDDVAELEDLDAPPEPDLSPASRLWGEGTRWAFDPYRAKTAFGAVSLPAVTDGAPLVLAIGSERGWTPAELDLLADRGFSFASLGDRILKTETAAVTAVAVALSKFGYV